MAVVADQVIVELEARVARYNREVQTAVRRFDRGMKRIEGSATRMERQTERSMQGAGQAVRRAVSGIAAALGTREIVRYGDAWTAAGNKLAAAAQISGIQEASLSDLADRAIAARTAFEPYVDLYSRIQRAGGNLGITQQQVADATDIVARSFIAGGATAQEMASGILQLGQALASGELLGEELRAVRENAPLLARAIAEEFDTTIGGLKDLGQEGELTAERVIRGILNAEASIEAAFATTNATIGDSFQNLRTALIRFIGDADDVVGATETLASALNALAENLDLVATGAALLTARAVAPLAVALASRLAPAARTAATALQLLAVQGGAALVAAQAFRGALALLGGPVGALLVGLTGVGFALASFDTGARTAEEGINRLRAATDKAQSSLSELQSVEQSLEDDTDALKEANDRLNDAVASGGEIAEATARADVAAISRRIQANEQLRDAILATIQAQEQALRAEALVAERAFRREFAGPALGRVQTGAPGEGGPLGIAQGRATTVEEQVARQQAALDELAQSAEEALEAGNVTEFQQRFLEARAELLQTKTAADELASSIEKVLSGEGLPEAEQQAASGSGGGAGAGAGGGGDTTQLNAFEQAVASLREQSLSAAAEIRELNALNPTIDNYAISLKAAAIEHELLTAAQEAGVEVNREQIRNLAEGTAALEEQRRAAQDFGSGVDGIRAETRAIERETVALRGINPAMDEYGRATETALAEQELLNLAIEAGIPLTDEMRAAIRRLAEGYGAASAALRETREEQREFKQGVEEFKRTQRDLFEGFIQGALDGKSAVDILADSLDKLGQKLMDLALDAIFDTGGGQGGLAGFLSGISSGLGSAAGGIGGGGGGQSLSAAPHLGLGGTFGQDVVSGLSGVSDNMVSGMSGVSDDMVSGMSGVSGNMVAGIAGAVGGLMIGLGNLIGGGAGKVAQAGGALLPMALAALFDEGGPTGGRRGQPAGIVHGEEFVVRAGPAQKFRPLLERINEGQGLPGFQSGGFVPPASGRDLTVPRLATRTMDRGNGEETTINLGGLHVHGVRDADSFRRSEPQMMADLNRKLRNVSTRGTA